MRWSPGDTVAFWDGSALAFAVIVGEEKRRLRLVLAGGRETRVPPGRLAFVLETGGETPTDAAALERAAVRAADAERRARERAAAIDVELVWELAADADTAVGLDALAGLALEEDDGAARAALVLAFLDDGLHFSRKGDHWQARDREAVAGLRHEREVADRRERERDAAREILAAAGAGRDFDPDDLPPGVERDLAALEEVVLLDLDASDASRSRAQAALDAAGVRCERPVEGAFRLLRRFGRWDHDDANVEIDRHRLRTEFPAEVVAAAAADAARGFDRAGRTDRTDALVVTIDDAATREIDDGLSIAGRPGGGWVLGIHIADPCAFVPAGGPVDEEARRRGATYYFPDRKLTMLPESLAEGAASLVEGEDRPALTFRVDLDADGELLDAAVERSVVRARRRLTYAAVDAHLDPDAGTATAGGAGDAPAASESPVDASTAETLAALDAATTAREACRVRRGALRLASPEIDVRIDADGTPRVERLPAVSTARRIVTEAMVLAGEAAARCAARAGVPLVHRRQPAPEGGDDLAGRSVSAPEDVRRVRMGLRRGETGVEPGPHFALAAEAYAQATSPLRRYADLANHRQLAAIASGEPAPYDRDALAEIAALSERAERDGRRAERAAVRYWLLAHLRRRIGDTVEGVVVETGGRTVVQLAETLLEETVPGLEGVAPGDPVTLRVAHANPRADVLRLRPELRP